MNYEALTSIVFFHSMMFRAMTICFLVLLDYLLGFLMIKKLDLHTIKLVEYAYHRKAWIIISYPFGMLYYFAIISMQKACTTHNRSLWTLKPTKSNPVNFLFFHGWNFKIPLQLRFCLIFFCTSNLLVLHSSHWCSHWHGTSSTTI